MAEAQEVNGFDLVLMVTWAMLGAAIVGQLVVWIARRWWQGRTKIIRIPEIILVAPEPGFVDDDEEQLHRIIGSLPKAPTCRTFEPILDLDEDTCLHCFRPRREH